LHANWSEGRLYLWGESPARYAHRGGRNGDDADASPKPGRHPFASAVDELREAVATICGDLDDRAPEAIEGSTILVRLPHAGDEPLPSDRLAGRVGDFTDADADGLRPIEVPALSIAAEAALGVLLSVGCRRPDRAIEYGPGVRYLVEVGEFVADLLAEQRFVPTLYRESDAALEAGWTPWLEDRDVARRVESLLATMPPSVWAAVDQARHVPWSVLSDAVESMVDAVVRQTLHEENFIDALDGREVNGNHTVLLLRGLLDQERRLEAPESTAAELFREVRQWLGRLGPPADVRPYRLCLRLNEPLLDEDDAEAIVSGEEVEWEVSLHLQPVDRRGLLIDVQDLWREQTPGAAVRGRAEDLQDFVLREIGRAARIDERLKAALDDAVPRSIHLSTGDAYEFLRETAPILEEDGFDVIVPEWWGAPTGRLGTRLVLRSEEEDAPAADDGQDPGAATRMIGLRALVHYEWQLSVGDRPLSPEEFRRLAAQAAPLVRVDGRWVEITRSDLDAAAELLERDGEGDMTVLEAMQAAYGVRGESPKLPVFGVESSGWLRELLEGRAAIGRFLEVGQPAAFQGELRPYQLAGVSWLAFLDRLGLGGCLADDMGLGKTIQLIALLQHEREHRRTGDALGPTLIVAPMSVLSNWMREMERFSPELSVHVHHGPERPVGESFALVTGRSDVVITTYGLVNRDVESLQRVQWRRVVLDEAQYVKNTPTKQAQAIRALSAERRVALTGTPVENRLSELWSIMDFLNPGYLGTSGDFRRRFAIPIERHRDRRRAEALRGLIRPFVLRRLKTDPEVVPDLPSLVQTKEFAVLTPEQARLYQQVVDGMLNEVERAEGMQRRGLVLAGIVRLKQICNHPANLADGAVPGSRAEGDDAGSLSERSGKVQCLLERLEEVVAAGDQALVFTQYRRMGQLLARMIQHDLNAPVLFLHGGTPRAKRQKVIDQFQDESVYTPVFILSLRAGGVGLNLTAANHVFHFDRWWNPAVENQATDRAFRIGQKRTVQVHKLICTGTLEERIDEMLEEKVELAEQIVGAGDGWLTELSTSQLRDVLTLRESALEAEPA